MSLSGGVDFLGDRSVQASLAARRVVWAVFFCFSLAIGRIVSLAIDGRASPLLDVYLGLEIIGGLLGLVVLAYARD